MLKIPYADIKGMQNALDMFSFCYDNKLDYDMQIKARKYRKTLKETREILRYSVGAKTRVTVDDMYEFSKFAYDISGFMSMDSLSITDIGCISTPLPKKREVVLWRSISYQKIVLID